MDKMTDTSISDKGTIGVSGGDAAHGSLRDYLRLLKPRVMSLSIFTALAGMVAAPTDIHPLIGIAALLFIAIGAGAAGALNMWSDADIDRLMSRTAMRPIPRNLVPAEEALALGLFLSGASVFCLGVLVNWVAAGLLAATIAHYILIYTMWLKRSTPQNIVIGGAAGAFPPMIGWAAASGDVTLNSILLFAIIFFWTPAHFWALALLRSRDYERAGVPMLPNAAGKRATQIQILVYAVLTGVFAVAPWFTGLGGVLYLAAAVVTSAALIYLSVDLLLKREGHAADKAAKRLFSYSIFYLFAVFAAILAEHALGLV
jgi:protoheme IX farnesyltransferase